MAKKNNTFRISVLIWTWLQVMSIEEYESLSWRNIFNLKLILLFLKHKIKELALESIMIFTFNYFENEHNLIIKNITLRSIKKMLDTTYIILSSLGTYKLSLIVLFVQT